MSSNKPSINYTKLLNTSGVLFIGGILISFVSSWVITKILNKEDVGAYQLMINLLETIALIATSGFQLLAVREIPLLQKNNQHTSNFTSQGTLTILFSSIVILPITFIVFYNISDNPNQLFVPLIITCLLIPFFAIQKFYSSVLHGFQKIYLAVFPEKIVRPALVVILSGGIWLYNLYSSNSPISSTNSLLLLLSLFVIFVLIVTLVFKSEIKKLSKTLIDKTKTQNYYKSALILVPIVLLGNLNLKIDSFMILGLDKIENYAVYAQSVKFAFLCSIGLLIYDHVFAPQIAANTTTSNKKEINKFIVKKIRLVFILSVIVFITVALFGDDILATFGKKTDHYEEGYIPLLIIGIGQLINVFFGPVTNILIMTKHEKQTLISFVTSLVSNIVFNSILIPLYGITGAAIATTIGITIGNVMMYYFVRTKTQFKSAAFDRT